MDEQERTCKTCVCFNSEANYCRCIDSSQAEWDTCPEHETMDEFDARMKAKRAREIKELTEKTDIWNELWENATVIDTDPNSWLGKIKAEGDRLKEKAEKWDKAHSGVNDDEMPFTPERISLIMNFVNDHFPDFDTPKEFEDMITEYSDWETELTEAEDKLEAIRIWMKEEWSNMNAFWQLDLTTHEHPRWRLADILKIEK